MSLIKKGKKYSNSHQLLNHMSLANSFLVCCATQQHGGLNTSTSLIKGSQGVGVIAAPVITAFLQLHNCQLSRGWIMPPRNNVRGSCCGVRRWGSTADPRLANLISGPPWGLCTVNISQSSPTAELAHLQGSHTTAPQPLQSLTECPLPALGRVLSPHATSGALVSLQALV